MSPDRRTDSHYCSPAAQRCIEFMLDQIRTGQLHPATRLGENSVARQLGLGRGPVRTAFQRLHAMGLLHSHPGAGTFVHQISLEHFCEVMDARACIEGFAGRLACARATEAELDELEKLAVKMDPFHAKAMTGGPKALAQMMSYDNEFHGGIVRLSGNRELQRMLNTQHILERGFLMGMNLPSGEKKLAGNPFSHRDIVRAMRNRDPDLTERTLRQHVLVAKEAQVQEAMGARANLAEVEGPTSTPRSGRQARLGARSLAHGHKVSLWSKPS